MNHITNRERRIIKAALDHLHERESQLADAVLHGEVSLRVVPSPLLSEFESAMRLADAAGLVIGVPARYGSGFRWTITEEGEARRLEMERA